MRRSNDQPLAPGASEPSESSAAVDTALLELLGDESPVVWDAVRVEFEGRGRAANPLLKRAAASEDPRTRARARLLIQAAHDQRTLRRLLRLACQPEIDLEQALWVLSRLERADFDARPYRRALDAFGRQVTQRITGKEGLSRCLEMVECLREYGFQGSADDYHHPDNIYLHRAIERRQGMPLTLTAIYLSVARRAGITASAVPLPGHVLLRLYSGRRSVLVDPFHGGVLRTRRELIEYLSRNGLVAQAAWFRDANDAQLLHRHLMNLIHSSRQRGLTRRARDLQSVAQALSAMQQTTLRQTPAGRRS